MKPTLLCATFLVLSACGAEGGGGNYLGTAGSPIMPGPAGIGGGGQGAAGTPFGGGAGGTPAGVAGMNAPGGAAGSGTAGGTTGGVSGSGGMAATSGSGGVGGAPQGGMGGGAGGAPQGGAGGGGGPSMGTLTVSFTTVSYDGEYAPLNYGAIWFETAGGEFIKTAKRWAGMTHQRDLVAWAAASGTWPSPFLGGGNAADMMDAISMPTIRTHQMHTVMWDMKDLDGMLVPDGDYVAVLEMSESRSRDREGPIIRIPFTKGSAPQMAMPANQEGFMGVSLSYTP